MLRRAGTFWSRVRAPPRGRSTASVAAHARWRLPHVGKRRPESQEGQSEWVNTRLDMTPV